MSNKVISTPVSDAVQVLELGLTKVGAIVQPTPTPYYRCLLGLADLARHHGRTLVWALDEGNRPTAMVTARVLLELIFNLDYILEVDDYKDYRASLLLLEEFERKLAFQNSRHTPYHPQRKALIAILQDEKDAMLTAMSSMRRGPNDPERWSGRRGGPKGVNVWQRAQAGNWEESYALLYELGSGYVHSDGYAIQDLAMPARESDAILARFTGNFVMVFTEELFKAFPELDSDQSLVRAWNRYGEMYCKPPEGEPS